MPSTTMQELKYVMRNQRTNWSSKRSPDIWACISTQKMAKFDISVELDEINQGSLFIQPFSDLESPLLNTKFQDLQTCGSEGFYHIRGLVAILVMWSGPFI